MDKQTGITSSKFISGSVENIQKNAAISLENLKDITISLEKVTKSIIIPLMKIQKKISMKFDLLQKDYDDLISKCENINQDILQHQNNFKGDQMNITDIQQNQRPANNHENFILFYEQVLKHLNLFNTLLNSSEFVNIVSSFNQLIPDQELFEEEDQEILEKIEKDNTKIKKNNKPKKEKKEKVKEKEKDTLTNHKKDKRSKIKSHKEKKHIKKINRDLKENKDSKEQKDRKVIKKKSNDIALLDILHKEFSTDNYIQKISKTFLKRRLTKKIIYHYLYEYDEQGQINTKKYKTSGDSTIYKFGKFSFKFLNDEIKNTDLLDELLGKKMKQQFAKFDRENNIYVIGGKISQEINEFIKDTFATDLYNQFGVVSVNIQFYEFNEELVSEFDESDPDVRIIFCDEKALKNLRNDWRSLKLAREFVSNYQIVDDKKSDKSNKEEGSKEGNKELNELIEKDEKSEEIDEEIQIIEEKKEESNHSIEQVENAENNEIENNNQI